MCKHTSDVDLSFTCIILRLFALLVVEMSGSGLRDPKATNSSKSTAGWYSLACLKCVALETHFPPLQRRAQVHQILDFLPSLSDMTRNADSWM